MIRQQLPSLHHLKLLHTLHADPLAHHLLLIHQSPFFPLLLSGSPSFEPTLMSSSTRVIQLTTSSKSFTDTKQLQHLPFAHNNPLDCCSFLLIPNFLILFAIKAAAMV